MLRIITRDVLVALIVLVPLLCLDGWLTLLTLNGLEAHGMGAHVPDAGLLREDYERLAAGITTIIMGGLFLLTIVPVVYLGSRLKVHLWSPSRPWNQKDEEAGRREAAKPLHSTDARTHA